MKLNFYLIIIYFYFLILFREQTMITQIELDKKIHLVNSKLYAIRDESILRKSNEKRLDIYKQIQRQIEEKRKIEEEKKSGEKENK